MGKDTSFGAPYQIGSDPKTVKLAAEAVRRINTLLADGKHQEAEAQIERMCRAANRPLREEFLHAVEHDDDVPTWQVTA